MRRHYPPSRHFLDVQHHPIAHHAHSRQSSTVVEPAPLRCSPPQHQHQQQQQQDEGSLRVQLQEQRLMGEHQHLHQHQHQHHAIIVSQKIPGIRTSAAFFASLRTNLSLNASSTPPNLPPSPASTPPSLATSTHSLPPPSPLAAPVDPTMDHPDAAPPEEDPLAGVPELRTAVTADDDERVDALKLVADGVAQMRQQANTALIFHPLNLALLVAVLALLAQGMLARGYDAIAVGTTCTGIVFAALAGVRVGTQSYISRAETIDRDWLGAADVVVTKFGDDVIGAAVIDWLSGESKTRRKKAWRGEIKGWSVKMRYRKKGVGAALLEEAVKESKKKGAESLDFAVDHANSLRVLPSLYNKPFERREDRARDLLLELQASSPSKHRRRRGGSNGGSR